MKKRFTFLLLALLLSISVAGQEVSPEILDYAKRFNDKSKHIEVTYGGKFIKSVYGYRAIESYLIGAIFQKENGDLLNLTFPAKNGLIIKPLIDSNETVEIRVSGDQEFLEKVPYKTTSTKTAEKELKKKVSGIGYLLEVKTKNNTFLIDQNSIDTNKTGIRNSQTFETVIAAKVLSSTKIKGREYLLFLGNGDSLLVDKSISNNEDHLESNFVSYVRPVKNYVPGSFIKSKNTLQMASGMIIQTKYGSSVMPSFGQISMFLDQKTGTANHLISNELGLISFLETQSESEKITYRFSENDAQAIGDFVDKNKNEELSLFYRNRTSNGYFRSEHYNFLYALCTKKDTLRLNNGFASGEESYQSDPEEISGVVTSINLELVNKDDILRGIVLDDKFYIKISSRIASSVSKLIKEGKTIKIEGWKRNGLEGEINKLGYSIFIPSKITVDGTTFKDQVNLAGTL
ncbi:hypothetical protein [Roseivirga sp.]|uniref:hypothetical protein n=1 Tax=Roseivirga sp. TaxID=1964215 RepID=UPI002B27BEA0|nr:hypothetical protein [Roseivirga sp.]